MRAAFLAVALLVSLSPASRAASSCTRDCRAESQKCRDSCVHNTKTSEDQLICRDDCVRDDDACRCGCGEPAFCEGGDKGQSPRGCTLPVARRDAVSRFVEALARK